jgi:5-methylthioadenosine/S-adenosylhomocysteine deaminase
MVSPDLIAIHMTDIQKEDLPILEKRLPNIVHCPESNMKLASGSCPVQKLLQMGLNVALGTDGAASNNDLDMIGEMRSAAFLGKLSSGDPKAVSAQTAMKMATLNAARALGVDKASGSLTPGKNADFIAIDLSQIETQPIYHPLPMIVYAASRNQVTDVWIDGKKVLENRKLLTLDEEELLNKAKSWRNKIKS